MSSPRGLVVGGMGGMTVALVVVFAIGLLAGTVGTADPLSSIFSTVSPKNLNHPLFPHPIHLIQPPVTPLPLRRIFKNMLIDLNCRFACGTYLLAYAIRS